MLLVTPKTEHLITNNQYSRLIKFIACHDDLNK